MGSAQWRTVELPGGGLQNCLWFSCSVASPLSGGGLGEWNAVAVGEHDVGVVQQPVDGGVCDFL